MIIVKDKGKYTFTISGITLGKLLAIQHAFEVVVAERPCAYTVLKEEVHNIINSTIEVESTPSKEYLDERRMRKRESK